MVATGVEEQEQRQAPTLQDGGQQGQAYDGVDSSHALDNTTSLPPLPRLQDGHKMVEHGIFPSTKVASIDDAIPIGGKPSDEAEHGMFPSAKEAIYDTSDGDESLDANLTALIFGGDLVESGEHGIFPSPTEAYGVDYTEHNPMCCLLYTSPSPRDRG